MVKGISKQVIVVQGADAKMFEQAIFILKEGALKEGITDDDLLKEAKLAIRGSETGRKGWGLFPYGAFWAAAGALVTGLVWLTTVLI